MVTHVEFVIDLLTMKPRELRGFPLALNEEIVVCSLIAEILLRYGSSLLPSALTFDSLSVFVALVSAGGLGANAFRRVGYGACRFARHAEVVPALDHGISLALCSARLIFR